MTDANYPEGGTRKKKPKDRAPPTSLHDAHRALHAFHALPQTTLAATAKVHGLSLATRNTDDFQACGIKQVNPWEYPG